MSNLPRRYQLFVLAVVAAMTLGAGASLASSYDEATEPDTVCEPVEVPGDTPVEVSGDKGECPETGEGVGEDPVDHEDGAESEEPEAEASDDEVVDPEREAECNTAAGIEEEPEGEEDPTAEEPEKKTGLERAIEVVLANCIKNEQAPGLVNALEHLVANLERHEAHEEAKAEREAAREAAKAARDAAKAEREAAREAAKAAREAEREAKHEEHGKP